MEMGAGTSVAGEDWAVLRRLLPGGWEEEARRSGALKRARGVDGAESLLRVLLMHLAAGCSLAETESARRKLTNEILANIYLDPSAYADGLDAINSEMFTIGAIVCDLLGGPSACISSEVCDLKPTSVGSWDSVESRLWRASRNF
jgi:hypothetical protein